MLSTPTALRIGASGLRSSWASIALRVGPEQRAVLAHAPALVLEAARGHRHFQVVRGPAALDVLCTIEAREMSADDLVGAVALDVAGARIPADDVARGVQAEGGVVRDPLDQPAQTLFAVPQPIFVLAPRRQVAGDLRVPSSSPSTLRRAVMTTLAQKRVPSLRRR